MKQALSFRAVSFDHRLLERFESVICELMDLALEIDHLAVSEWDVTYEDNVE